MKNIIDEKKVGVKEAIKVISSLNTSPKLLVSEVLKLVNLILLVPATDAVIERSSSTLSRVKTQRRSSMTQEPVTSCLIVTTYKKQKDNLKLVKVISQFCFENEHRF